MPDHLYCPFLNLEFTSFPMIAVGCQKNGFLVLQDSAAPMGALALPAPPSTSQIDVVPKTSQKVEVGEASVKFSFKRTRPGKPIITFLPLIFSPRGMHTYLKGMHLSVGTAFCRDAFKQRISLCLKSPADDRPGSLFPVDAVQSTVSLSSGLSMGLMAEPDRHLVCRQAGGKFCRSHKDGLRSRGARAEASRQACAEDWKVRPDFR